MKDYSNETIALGPSGGDIAQNNSAVLAMFAPAKPRTPVRVPAGTDLLRPNEPAPLPGSFAYRALGKRILDILLVLMTAPLTLSVVLICALALWIEGGNPFYRQDRLGVGGRRFSILKLRTMVRDADTILARYLEADPALAEEWRTTQKLKNDPRITRIGSILRKTSLDELPQFWNVLLGEMSLVGPRPMMPDQLEMYGDPFVYFAMRPGITGFWQVSARNENHFSFRAEIDAQYHRKMSPLCDLGVMLRTVGVMMRRTGY
ncbi:sugar transferase [Oceaniglobus ichthyenteri]|uniref:sugar transferase n=1 Tax=Oceaniglobus ichthyenteri TaxID=2136177 RepID=UPI001F0C7AB1|nr:sugar transferase [Oceaniglobus ichthyenteri]